MLATVRNRRALISSVEPFDGSLTGWLHLVTLEYTDPDGIPEEMIIGEREISPSVLEPTALPQVATEPPMLAADFDAMQRSTRWTALSPFLPPDRSVSNWTSPVASPFFGAVQVEDFQLVPLLKALRMPRISLLLTDDVGLGKTVEAGLILTELLLRRRTRRVLILCPAALRQQWQQEMKVKFSLSFDVVDRAETHALQKRLGLDANPWRTFPRIITSYHYLRQPDVLEQFRAACAQPEGAAQLPWDLLIVDEAHNLMPSNLGEDSDLSKMLRAISPWFEHKLFLSATPHNGHTRCFSGLLEQLDPVRFTQSSEFTDAMRQRIEQVVVRRLKREINALDEQAGQTPRFCERRPRSVPLYFSPVERKLSIAFAEFRSEVKKLIATRSRTEQIAGAFAVEVLNKRLLSCPYAFASSWYRFREGTTQDESAELAAVQAARRSLSEDLDDDQETEGRLQYATKTTGAWFKPLISHLQDEIAAVDLALQQLGLVLDANGELPQPREDERWERLIDTIEQYLRLGNQWRGSDRIVVFTEYKTTLDYLEERLKQHFKKEPEIVRVLYGGMDDRQRDEIKQAFNDPTDPVRVLIATDAASEGLNLQETAYIVGKMATDLTNQIKARLKLAGQAAQQEEKDRFRQRLQEVERAMRETTIQKIEKERDELLSDMQQLSLIPDERRAQEERLRDLDEELRRRKSHYQDLLDQLKREQVRVLEGILPKRYSLRGTAQVFPVTVEIRFSTLLDTVLEDVLGLTGDWQKGSQVGSPSETLRERLWSYPAITREIIRPRRVWQSPQGDVLPVFVADGQDGGKVARLGIGRGKRLVTRVVEWLRKANQKVALLTNGYQWRLIHARANYDAWCEWDITFWFEEGQPGLQVTALRLLLGVQSLQAQQASGLSPLIAAIDASRQGQGEISEVLGERVRQAVELLIRESSESLTQLRTSETQPVSSRHIYIAATRIIMRCVVILFAEARDLLPRDNPIYHSAYGLQGLREQLDRRAGGRAAERLRQGVSAWSRLLALSGYCATATIRLSV